MRFKIPSKLVMGGQNISINFVDKCKTRGINAHGIWRYRKGIIEIEKTDKISSDYLGHVFFHELVHCILDNIAENELNNNEPFVERFSESLYQAIKTME